MVSVKTKFQIAFIQIQCSTADCHSVLNMVCICNENMLYCVVNAEKYDVETGFYYVSSRYYDPEVGRFINADSLVSTGQGILGNNMFAYCLNNPVKCL